MFAIPGIIVKNSLPACIFIYEKLTHHNPRKKWLLWTSIGDMQQRTSMKHKGDESKKHEGAKYLNKDSF